MKKEILEALSKIGDLDSVRDYGIYDFSDIYDDHTFEEQINTDDYCIDIDFTVCVDSRHPNVFTDVIINRLDIWDIWGHRVKFERYITDEEIQKAINKGFNI